LVCDQLAALAWVLYSSADRSDERAVRKEWGEHESLSVQKVTRWESEAFVFTAGLPCSRIMTAKWEPGLLSSY
jgi:hypothetical protein